MRRRRGGPYIAAFFAIWIVFGLVGFAFGYYIGPIRLGNDPQSIEEPNNNKEPLANSNEQENPEGTDAPEVLEGQTVTSHEISVGEDTKVVYRTHFTQCQTIEDEVAAPDEDMLGLKEQEFKAHVAVALEDWQVVRFSGDEVILFQTKNQICPNHFLVSHQDGYIAIYQFNEDGVKYLVEKTAIPISILPKVDQDKLSRGILLKTQEEVNQLLEDYSS